MHRAWLDMGTNIDRERSIQEALRRLQEVFTVRRTSSIYESDSAEGPPGQPPFYNLVVAFETEMSQDEVRLKLREIEAAMGRVRTREKWAPRTIDLDLLLYDDGHPHPSLTEHAYVMVPFAELEPERAQKQIKHAAAVVKVAPPPIP
ncbi:MAG: 2-amino-4-hydroxy-6-hydroxymethyldihydropteridine diphosphokinase [Candidatus Xenobia bacterium]